MAEVLDAVKKESKDIKEDTNASITKKCPSCPGSKCSPSNFIIAVNYVSTIWNSFALSYLSRALFYRLYIYLDILEEYPYNRNNLFAFCL